MFAVIAVLAVKAASSLSFKPTGATPAVEIAPGVFYPIVQLGACTDCATGQACCGSNLTASWHVWAEAHSPTGVIAIDTQLRYNDTEIVARELAKLARPRNLLWITTKIDPKVYCHASDPKTTALQMMKENLVQLKVNFVDLALLHEPCDVKGGKPHPSDQLAWEAMMQAVKNGWARAIGVDRFTTAQIDALKGTKPAVLMAPMSMAKHDDDTIEYCQRNGIHYNAFGIMHGCMFTDPTVTKLAAQYNTTTAQICGTWTRQRNCTMTVGAGTNVSKMSRDIHEDLDIFSFNMTDSEMDTLNKLQDKHQSLEWI